MCDVDQNVINMGEFLQNRFFSEDDCPRTGSIHPEFSHTMTICVDSYQDGLASGRIHTYFFEDAVVFHSLDQMLFSIEDILDRAGESQRDTQLRTDFSKAKPQVLNVKSNEEFFAYLEESGVDRKAPFYTLDNLHVRPGVIASYYIRILARQHSSMQGVINRCERGGNAAFRSEMELLTLIREDLNAETKWYKAGGTAK